MSVSKIKQPIIGIVGGICAGKSTVAAEFGKLGCKVINADEIAHKAIDSPAIRKKITKLFGSIILGKNGKIDRRKLADVVFQDGKKLSLLNDIIHPIVLARIEKLIEKYNQQPRTTAIILDIPLLVEIGWHKRCDRVIFVDADPDARLERAKKAGFNKSQLKIREKFQISLDKKGEIADNYISASCGLSELARQVADIFSELMENR